MTFVPGAWLGSWAWNDVTSALRASGQTVYPITLTGLADRSHLARPEVDLTTHITDIVNLIETEGLTGVTLVGTAVADRIPNDPHTAHPASVLLYGDAWIGEQRRYRQNRRCIQEPW